MIFISDNSSVAVYLQNQGGTQSLPMFRLTWDILLFCQQHGITLLLQHIPVRLNALADSLSRRHHIIGTEWSLHLSIVWQMFSTGPQLDLFATCHNKPAAFVSPVPDPQTVAVDALSNPWDRCWACINSVDAASASQVGSLRSVLNAFRGSISALTAVTSNASQLVSRFSSGGAPMTSTAETASVGEFCTTIQSRFICSLGT